MTTLPGATKTLNAPPAPTGNPALLRAYASALRELAATLRRMAGTVSAPLPVTWRGDAPMAAAATATRLAAEFRVAATAVDDIAAHLDSYAGKLAAASAHHHHWLKLVAEVAGVVLVTAAVVTITVATAGAAAPVAAGLAIEAEAGAAAAGGAAAGGAVAGGAAAGGAAAGGAAAETTAAAAVTGMETAAASATSAETSLLGSLGARALPLLRQLGTFVRPQLVGAEVSTGFDAAVRLAEHKGISPLSIGVDFTENVAAGAGLGAAAGHWLTRPGIAAWLGRKISPAATEPHGRAVLLRHVTNASTNAGVGAAEDEIVGRKPTARSLGLDFAEGAIGSQVGDIAAAHDTHVHRGVSAVRHSRIPSLRVDAGGRVLRGLPGTVYRVDPHLVRFSQRSLNNTDLRVTALAGGWKGDPIDVMVMPDGSLTSLDNRRVMAARAHGIQAKVRLMDPHAVVPADLLAARFSRYHLPEGSTWREVFQARIDDQGRAWKLAHPNGSYPLPAKVTAGSEIIIGLRPPRRVVRES